MAYQSVWYFTDLPKDIVDIIERDVSQRFDVQMQDSRLAGDELNKEKRNSQNAWIPTHHWVGGFLWHYIQRANRENFLYDLRNIDNESFYNILDMKRVSFTDGIMTRDFLLNINL